MPHSILDQFLILLVTTVVVVAVFRRLRLPPILGYLFVGMVLGPYALGWLENGEITHLLGEIGIAFLLFIIGLEFSIPQFWRMRRILLGLGGIQVLAGTVSGAVIAWYSGIQWPGVLIVGGALAMSSTAIVIKQLTEQAELHSPHGRLALGILLFQDLAAVVFLVMIPVLGREGQSLGLELSYALLKAVLAFATVLAAGRWFLRPLFHEITSARSPELFTLTVLLVSLLAAWFTQLMGLSLALGAFLAGMMLSETEYRHQVEAELRPFRDILLGLFFITVGMQLNLTVLPDVWPWVVLLVIGLVFGKGLLITLLALASKADKKTALATGLVLAHGGEFGFALLALAIGNSLLLLADTQAILVAVVLTMLLAPMLIRYSYNIIQYLFPETSDADEQAANIAQAMQELTPVQHIIICGYGRVGRVVASLLRSENIAFVALDLDPNQIKQAWEDSDNVFYGDACHTEILNAAGLMQARALVVSFDDAHSAVKIVRHTRTQRDDIPILVRAEDDANLELLAQAGATEVIPETLEASLMLVMQLLLALGLSTEVVAERIQSMKKDRYHLLHRFM